ncbi:MAG: glycosyltransferase family 2 protein [Desulfobacterales bacterium]|nr:glycosyltransferase family 2 protein [Desulfobacterales bacterium]
MDNIKKEMGMEGTEARRSLEAGVGETHGLSLVIPAFNEEKGIVGVVRQIVEVGGRLGLPCEIIVVDDGSTDSTPAKLAGLAGIRLVRHQRNAGYGAALKSGIRAARYNWICITDGDGTYPNEKIPDLLAAMDKNDMVVGARLGAAARIPLIRRPAKWLLNKLANYLVQHRIPDLNSGLRIFDKRIAQRFLNILPDGFSFTSTITLAMLSNNYRVLYLPIEYHVRTGKSKIRPIHDTLNFLQLIVRTILYFDPLRIFLPAGISLILVSTVLFGLRQLQGGGYGVTIPMFLLAGIQVLAIGMLADLIDRRMKP